jgi:hypothetical protein
MKVRIKFEQLIRQHKDPEITFRNTPNGDNLARWVRAQMPGVVDELIDLGWNLQNEDTWLETVFVSHYVKWYGRNVAVFVTSSFYDYMLAERFLSTKTGALFRKQFNIDYHLSLLLHDYAFIEPSELDDIFLFMSPEQSWGLLDMSHVDDEKFSGFWAFLDEEEGGNDWTHEQLHLLEDL